MEHTYCPIVAQMDKESAAGPFRMLEKQAEAQRYCNCDSTSRNEISLQAPHHLRSPCGPHGGRRTVKKESVDPDATRCRGHRAGAGKRSEIGRASCRDREDVS